MTATQHKHVRALSVRDMTLFRVSGIPVVCIGLLGTSVLLFVYVPGEGFDWPAVLGAGASILLGEVAIRWAERERLEVHVA